MVSKKLPESLLVLLVLLLLLLRRRVLKVGSKEDPVRSERERGYMQRIFLSSKAGGVNSLREDESLRWFAVVDPERRTWLQPASQIVCHAVTFGLRKKKKKSKAFRMGNSRTRVSTFDNRHADFRKSFCLSLPFCFSLDAALLIQPSSSPPLAATDDPSKMVTVSACDGKSGESREISYTNCKVVGNGSFGVVFAARMMGEKQADGSTTPESDIAIKKVLQDKRFKVRQNNDPESEIKGTR